MIVDRRVFIAKQGKENEVVDFIKKGIPYVPFAAPYRVYTSNYAEFGQVVLEIEFKDLAECERYWAGFMAKVSDAWWAEWFSLTDKGGKAEVYNIVARG